MWLALLRNRGHLDTEADTLRGKIMWEDRRRWPSTGAGDRPSSQSPEQANPADILVSGFQPLDCERMHFSYFSPVLRYFVAALGTNYYSTPTLLFTILQWSAGQSVGHPFCSHILSAAHSTMCSTSTTQGRAWPRGSESECSLHGLLTRGQQCEVTSIFLSLILFIFKTGIPSSHWVTVNSKTVMRGHVKILFKSQRTK